MCLLNIILWIQAEQYGVCSRVLMLNSKILLYQKYKAEQQPFTYTYTYTYTYTSYILNHFEDALTELNCFVYVPYIARPLLQLEVPVLSLLTLFFKYELIFPRCSTCQCILSGYSTFLLRLSLEPLHGKEEKVEKLYWHRRQTWFSL